MGRFNSKSVRDHNLTLALTELIHTGGCSRTHLSAQTELLPGTVTLLVNELLNAGLIEETALSDSEGGRRKAQLVVSPTAYPVAVIELKLDSVRVVAETLSGTRLVDVAYPVDFRNRPVERFAAFAAARARELVSRLGDLGCMPLIALGVVVRAPILTDHRTFPIAIDYGWNERTDLAGLIARELGGAANDPNIVVMNDASCALTEEHRHAIKANTVERDSNIVYVKADIGIGGAALIKGEIYKTTLGTAMEVGHITIDPHGGRCMCGKRGCLVTVADPELVISRAGLADYEQRHGADAAQRELLHRFRAGEPHAVRALDTAIFYLGSALDTIHTLFTPDYIILGGYLVDYVQDITDSSQPLARMCEQGELRMIPAVCGENGPLMGGLTRIRMAILRCAGRLMRGEAVDRATFCGFLP